jgi:hypothetical protein
MAYTLGMSFLEFVHRLNFGTEKSAFVEFFMGPPPKVERFCYGAEQLVGQFRVVSICFKEEVDAFVEDLEMTEDMLDAQVQEYTQIQQTPENPFTTVLRGEISSKVIALVHIIIRFRLKRILRAVDDLKTYYSDDGAMPLPWHIDPIINPPPHVLQMEFQKAIVKLTGLLAGYKYHINEQDRGSDVYTLPNVWPHPRFSTHSQSGFDEYERSRTDDCNYDFLRNIIWGDSLTRWLGSVCKHCNAAMELIYYAKKVSRFELLSTRIALKIIPRAPEVQTEDIDIHQVLVNAMTSNDPDESEEIEEEYDNILASLSDLVPNDEEFAIAVQDGFNSTEPLGVRFFTLLINSIFPVSKKDMPKWDDKKVFKKKSNKEAYEKALDRWIKCRYPRIGCNRAIPWVEAVVLDELIKECYGNIPKHKNG